jgi:polynucleotide 5'-hydroxyl-kinase GRC3/NOL9
MDIPAVWERVTLQIRQHRWRKILVLGATDRGKSTFCRFLSQGLMHTGARVAIVDADVGQKDIGPPATLTLGYPQASLAGSPVAPVGWYFVGATSPARHLLPMVLGTQRLVEMAQAAYVIVNTTGFVHGPGRVLKGYKIDAIQPDVIVALARGHELAALLRPYRHYRTLYVPPSSQASVKSPEARKQARERAFGAYFATAQEVMFPWRRLIIQGSLLLNGKRVAHDGVRYLARTSEGLLGVARPDTAPPAGLTVLPADFARYLLCGVANRRNQGVGLALLSHIDFTAETVTLLTPVATERCAILQCGDLYVHPDGHELGSRLMREL